MCAAPPTCTPLSGPAGPGCSGSPGRRAFRCQARGPRGSFRPVSRLATRLLCAAGAASATPVPDRDLGHYTILGIRRVRLKNFAMEPPGCHVGVNCPSPSLTSSCGVLNGKIARFVATSQVVADNLCASEAFYEVFRNGPGGCSPDCTMIASPGPAPDCTSPFAPPLIDDLDGDGVASCSSACE